MLSNSKPKVSILLSVYNHEKYVKKSIDSILKQTYTNFELIILDNGSTDRSGKIISEFKDKRIVFLQEKKNITAYFGVQACFEKAKGELIAFMGSDDLWENTKLEKQVSFLEKNPEYGMVFTETDMIDAQGKTADWTPFFSAERNMSRYEWLRHFFFFSNCVCWPSCLMYKDLKEKTSYSDARFLQLGDFNIWIKALTRSSLYIYPEVLTHYRQHGENESQKNIDLLHNRSNLEITYIFQTYEKLSCEVLLAIFPELRNIHNFNETNKLYYLARISLDYYRDSPNYNARRMFGLQIIFSIYSRDDLAKNLEKSCHFGIRDFYTLTGLPIDISYSKSSNHINLLHSNRDLSDVRFKTLYKEIIKRFKWKTKSLLGC